MTGLSGIMLQYIGDLRRTEIKSSVQKRQLWIVIHTISKYTYRNHHYTILTYSKVLLHRLQFLFVLLLVAFSGPASSVDLTLPTCSRYSLSLPSSANLL